MTVRYIEKGTPANYRRVDRERTVTIYRTWKTGGLLYGYVDRFNVVCIALEDIVEIKEGR